MGRLLGIFALKVMSRRRFPDPNKPLTNNYGAFITPVTVQRPKYGVLGL
jgi:hypothetical protein